MLFIVCLRYLYSFWNSTGSDALTLALLFEVVVKAFLHEKHHYYGNKLLCKYSVQFKTSLETTGSSELEVASVIHYHYYD